jgi:shikimate dehydrogenase
MSAPKRYAVIGDPVSHSLSPLMHNGWMADHGLHATYEAYRLRSDEPVAAIRQLTQFVGMNVTVPHKEAAAAAADESDPAVVLLRAANVLVWSNGRMVAANTDCSGFALALSDVAPDWRRAGDVLVVGAGGAGRSVAYALAAQDGPRVTIVNRTAERAQEAARLLYLSGQNAVDVRPWSDLAACIAEADIVVNATSISLEGGPNFNWPLSGAKPNALVVDLVYRPRETSLLRQARARGLRTADGLGMLIHQAALSFEMWFGIQPDLAKARQRLMAALA